MLIQAVMASFLHSDEDPVPPCSGLNFVPAQIRNGDALTRSVTCLEIGSSGSD